MAPAQKERGGRLVLGGSSSRIQSRARLGHRQSAFHECDSPNAIDVAGGLSRHCATAPVPKPHAGVPLVTLLEVTLLEPRILVARVDVVLRRHLGADGLLHPVADATETPAISNPAANAIEICLCIAVSSHWRSSSPTQSLSRRCAQGWHQMPRSSLPHIGRPRNGVLGRAKAGSPNDNRPSRPRPFSFPGLWSGPVHSLGKAIPGVRKWKPRQARNAAGLRSARAAASLALRSDPAVQPPSFTPRRLAAARPALVRCEMSARSFCASAANKCRMKGSTSGPRSATKNGTQ